jgi:hypothetical protein
MVRSEGQVADKITVTADRKHIVGWQDGTTAARILWRDVGVPRVHGRWADREQRALDILLVFAVPEPRYPLVSTELVPAVTVEVLEAAIAPGNRGVVRVQAEVRTQRCTCAD